MPDFYPWWVQMAKEARETTLTQSEWYWRWHGYNRALNHVLIEIHEALRDCEAPDGVAVLVELKAQLYLWIEQEATYVAQGQPWPGAPPYPYFPALPPDRP